MKKLTTKIFLALFGLMMFANMAMGQTIILEEGFESGLPTTWLSIDNDGDGHFWTTDKNTLYSGSYNYTFPTHSGNGAIGSGSVYNNNNIWEALTPDNWLISPDISGANTVKYWVRSDIGGGPLYDTEHYGIYVSSTGRDINDFTMIAYDSTSGLYSNYAEREVSLPAGTKYVAFQHFNTTNQGAIVLDDIRFMLEINMDRWIELTVTQGQWIKLDLWADAENTPVKVESGTYDNTLIVGTDWIGFKNYYAQADTMKVYGNVIRFDCNENGSKITGLDASNNSGLTYLACVNNNLSSLDLTDLTALMCLNCFGNNLSSLNLTNLTALNYLNCSDNNLSACGLDSIFHQLPIRPVENKGNIYIKYGLDTNPGTSTCRDTIATNRNWLVLDEDGDIPIVNTTYECPYFTIGIEDIMVNNVKVEIYPNPASNNLNIECEERISSLELYDALGRMLISKENVLDNTSIDVSNLNSGIYILKIRTEKGSGEYKIIIE